MSYCRFSCDNWKSSVYCYADVRGGYTTIVAKMKYVGNIPELPEWGSVDTQTFSQAHQAQMDALDKCELLPVGLPHDGAIFNDPDLVSFRTRLLDLRALGYHVPQHALDAIEEEITEGAS